MEFDWNPAKDEWTREHRGFGFAEAAAIFGGETIEIVDDRFDYGEVRVRALGVADGKILAVVYTDRGELRWIISARKASRQERRQWHAKHG